MASKLSQLAQQKTSAQLQTLGRESVKWLTKKISTLRNPTGIASVIAKEQFRKDLLNDKDFIEYRKKSHEYGTINICVNYHYLYNDLSDVDALVGGIVEAQKYFKVSGI